MSLVLNLTVESILRPTRVDVFEVEAMMLWPDDARAREIGLLAAMTEHSIDHLPEAPPDVLEHVRRHIKSGAPLIRDIRPQIEDRQWHGSIVGLLTERASVGADLLGAIPVGELQSMISRKLKPSFQIEPRTMNNRAGPLFKFRPVAHLWGAYSVFLKQGKGLFPCLAENLPDFLGTAEAIRMRAETTRLPRSQHTVMRRGEAVRLPDSVKDVIPRMDFVLSDLSRNPPAIREKTEH